MKKYIDEIEPVNRTDIIDGFIPCMMVIRFHMTSKSRRVITNNNNAALWGVCIIYSHRQIQLQPDL